jgi:hypothetical protein
MNAKAEAFSAMAEHALISGHYDELSDSDLEQVLTAALKLYAAKAERDNAYPPPLTAGRVTPTEVVMVVSEMIRAAGLNLFDLSMWFNRVR